MNFLLKNSRAFLVFIILNVKSKFAKIYFLNSKNRRFVNKKFDFLHQQNKLN